MEAYLETRANRLLLVKCNDNKMDTLPGCPSVGVPTCSYPTTKKVVSKIILTTQDKHNLVCQKVARLKVSLAHGMIGRERFRYLD